MGWVGVQNFGGEENGKTARRYRALKMLALAAKEKREHRTWNC